MRRTASAAAALLLGVLALPLASTPASALSCVAGPGDPEWVLLPPRRSHRLVLGTQVRMGDRTFVLASPSVLR